MGALRKEDTLREVGLMPGPVTTASEVSQGAITAMERCYRHEGGLNLQAAFVGDVPVDFTITPGSQAAPC